MHHLVFASLTCVSPVWKIESVVTIDLGFNSSMLKKYSFLVLIHSVVGDLFHLLATPDWDYRPCLRVHLVLVANSSLSP